MTVRRLSALLALTVAVWPVAICALEFREARELQEYGQTIAVKKNQRVVMYDAKIPATSVLVVLKVPLEVAAPALRELARGRFGEASWRDREQADSAYWEAQHGPFPAERDKRMKLLETAQVVVGTYREITFQSDQYNVLKTLWWNRGHSRLTLWLIDGRRVFGRPVTLVRVQRRDEVLAWGWVFQVNPFPSYHRQGSEFVTDDELSLFPSFAQTTNAGFQIYPELNYSYSLLDSTEQLMRAAQWLGAHQ